MHFVNCVQLSAAVTTGVVFVHVGLKEHSTEDCFNYTHYTNTPPPVGLKHGFKKSVAFSILEDDSFNQLMESQPLQ